MTEQRIPGIEVYENALYEDNCTPRRLKALAEEMVFAFHVELADAFYLVENAERQCKLALIEVQGGYDPLNIFEVRGLKSCLATR